MKRISETDFSIRSLAPLSRQLERLDFAGKV